ncbi:MAG: phage tail sheath C-terminal domain-containing protein [Burkholderiales bacterium]
MTITLSTRRTAARVRNQVRALLERSSAYKALAKSEQSLISRNTVKAARFLVDGNGLSAILSLRIQTPDVNAPVANLVNSVDFPAFVAELINGVFHAIVNSSIEQMQAYGEWVAHAAQQVDEFMQDNNHAADAYLAQRWPDWFDFPPLRVRAANKSSALKQTLAKLTPEKTFSRPRLATVRHTVRQLLALERQQALLSLLNENLMAITGVDGATAPTLELRRVVTSPLGGYVEETAGGLRAIEGVASGVAGFVGLTALNPSGLSIAQVTSFAEYEALFGGALPILPELNGHGFLPLAVAGFFANGGAKAYIAPLALASGQTPNDADYIGSSNPPSGLAALAAHDGINLIVAPGITSPPVQRAMVAQCEARRERIAILDMPLHFGAQLTASPIDSNYAAAYWPWLSSNDAGAFVPPSGHLAGQYARLSTNRAPGNEAIVGANGLSETITHATLERLQSLNVNGLRVAPGRQDVVAWGVRTLSNDPDWKYVAIRRYAIYLEQSIAKGLQWAVFEPNTPAFWQRISALVENFLLPEWRNGALLGTKPEQAFFVKCDRSTMTQADIEEGRLVVVIGIAPVRQSEFVVIRIGLGAAS